MFTPFFMIVPKWEIRPLPLWPRMAPPFHRACSSHLLVDEAPCMDTLRATAFGQVPGLPKAREKAQIVGASEDPKQMAPAALSRRCYSAKRWDHHLHMGYTIAIHIDVFRKITWLAHILFLDKFDQEHPFLEAPDLSVSHKNVPS